MESFIFKCLFFFNLGFDKRCQRTFVLLETSALMSFCINETRRETAAVKIWIKCFRADISVSTHAYCMALPVCQTDNLQMSASGLRDCGLEDCPSNTKHAWEQRGASWPCMPLGFRSLRHIRGTLTDSLLCVRVHNHTHWDVQTHRQLTMHLCSCIIFTQLPMCAHALHIALRLGHTILHICAQAWLNSLFRPKKKNPKPNAPSSMQAHRERVPVFLCNFGSVRMPAACHPLCCLKVTVTCSHYTDIIHKQAYNKGYLPLVVCHSAWLYLLFTSSFLPRNVEARPIGILQPCYHQTFISRWIDKEYPFIYCVFCW